MIKSAFKIALAFLLIIAVIMTTLSVFHLLFPLKHFDIINESCDRYSVPPHLVLALIKAESNFSPDAVSSANAKGLMQLTDSTYEFCRKSLHLVAEEDIFHIESNLNAGIWYLSYLLKMYDGNIKNSVAAYNAGASNVNKWLGDPSLSSDGKTLDVIPFGETQRHVKKITSYSAVYRLLYPQTRK